MPLWVLAPHASAHDVFTTFNDGGDWQNTGLATLVGILSVQLSLIGPDAVVHMSEEVRNASKTIPRIMLATLVFNGALGFVMLVTLCFCIGNLEEVLETPTGYPFIQVSGAPIIQRQNLCISFHLIITRCFTMQHPGAQQPWQLSSLSSFKCALSLIWPLPLANFSPSHGIKAFRSTRSLRR